jgi:RNA ligase
MLQELNKLHDDGLLIKQVHPSKDLTIWNYSKKTTYERSWDVSPWLIKCRGLVTNSEGKIVARCIPKFFNWEELTPEMIPNEEYDVTEKMDGNYLSTFYYDNEWVIASRGSFISEQAIKGKEFFDQLRNKDMLFSTCTYIWELIYKEGRIVVNYGDFEGIIMIGCFDNETGIELDIQIPFYMNNFNVVKKYSFKNFVTIKSRIPDDAEGFVLRFKSGFRMKIKGTEYVRLHSIVTNVSSRVIWEHLKDDLPLDDIIERVPDEFYNWVKNEISTFQRDYRIIEYLNKEKVRELIREKYKEDLNFIETRKNVAEIFLSVKDSGKIKKSILFMIYEKKNYTNLIWDELYPEYRSPFRNNDI